MKKEVFDFYDRTSLKSYNLDRTMQDQLNMLDKLDVFTRKHCENVAAITCRLCEYLHMNKKFTEYCTICAYLHDIGKLFIPHNILQKPGKLTQEEYEIIKTHTTVGYKICMGDTKMRPYSAGTLYHHEALDGSGYPQGLTKKDIPFEAQIIRVADEYDAIVSKRQYKSHIDISDTLKIIIDNTKNHNKIDDSSVLSEIILNTKDGKNNPIVVKALIKVVLDDIEYEIYCTQTYVDYIKENITRFELMEKFYKKMTESKTQEKKDYYKEGIEVLLKENETFENYKNIYKEYIEAYEIRKEKISHLYDEIKKIKKLKI